MASPTPWCGTCTPLSSANESLARRTLALPWVADGLEQHEANVLNKLTGRLPVDTALGNLLLDLPWLPDGITPTESRAATSLVNLWRADPELGAVVFRLFWVLDDVTEGEAAGINALANIAQSDPSLAREVLGKVEGLLALPGSLAVDALVAVGQLGEFPDDLRSLGARPLVCRRPGTGRGRIHHRHHATGL